MNRNANLNSNLNTNDNLNAASGSSSTDGNNDDASLHERDVLPEVQETDINHVVTESWISKEDKSKHTQLIVQEFNKNVKSEQSAIVESSIRGRQIDRDEFFIIHKNTVTEIRARSTVNLAAEIRWPWQCGTVIEEIGDGVVKQNALFYGAHGSYVVNVPRGKYAKVRYNTTPMLLAEGYHVIHDVNFKFGGEPDLVDVSAEHINHSTIHILRVPVGQIAKVFLGTTPFLLYARANGRPYIFDNALFKFNGFVSQTEAYISHGTIHILRIPAGNIVKIWDGTEARLLESKKEPYVFHSPFFRLDDGMKYIPTTTPYINHGPLNILRVPSGRVAKVWEGSVAKLLESRIEPYFYDSPYFRLQKPSDTSLDPFFEDASAKLITHGAIKRLLPSTGEVAIVYDSGKLKIISPSETNRPIIIDSETCTVAGFLSTGIETLLFPSDTTKMDRRRENKNVTEDEINYEVFTTKDSLRVGVKLLVAYKIVDPYVAISLLKRDGILKHIENVATVDLGKAIQRCSSKDFLQSAQNKLTPITQPGSDSNNGNASSAPGAPLLEYFLDTVRNALAHDLGEYGIELIRLNFETPKILDVAIAKQMAEQAVSVAIVSAKEAVLEQNFKIASTEADQKVRVLQISQQQENAAKVLTARSELEAAKLRADATLVQAEAAAKAVLVSARANIEAQQLQGKQYDEHPSLLQLEMLKLQMDAMKNSHINIIGAPNEIKSFYQGNMPGFALMKQMQQAANNIADIN